VERTLQKSGLTRRRCNACDKSNLNHRWPGSPLLDHCEGITPLPLRLLNSCKSTNEHSPITSTTSQSPKTSPQSPIYHIIAAKSQKLSTDTSYLRDTRTTTSSPLVAFLKSAAVSPFTFRNGFTSVVGLKPSGGIFVHSFRTDRPNLDIDNRDRGYFTNLGQTQFRRGPVF